MDRLMEETVEECHEMKEKEEVAVVACKSAGIRRAIFLTSWKLDPAKIGLIDHSAICGKRPSVYMYI